MSGIPDGVYVNDPWDILVIWTVYYKGCMRPDQVCRGQAGCVELTHEDELVSDKLHTEPFRLK